MLKKNLFFLFSLTIFAIASTIISIFNYNPYVSSTSVFINFYSSFCLALAGIVAIFIYFIKIYFHKDKNIYGYFWPSIRQAIFFSLGITIILLFRGLRILDWWVGGPLLIAVVLLELFFQTITPNIKTLRGKKSNQGEE